MISIIFFFIFLTILIIIILFLTLKYMNSDHVNYLNYNSTYATKTGYLNPSDLGYSEMRLQRQLKYKFFDKIKKFVNAPVDAKVIYNSGSTESIATCINWAKRYNKYGSISGTSYDHPAIKENAENQDMSYKLLDDPENTNISAVFLTHVCSRTGEIIPEKYLNFSRSHQYLNKLNNEMEVNDKKDLLPYKPLIFLDATQSITKIPIDMEKWKINGLFFSLHKIGGPMNMGILIINEPKDMKFVPLIAGTQNESMRGGTLNERKLIKCSNLLKIDVDPITRKDSWEQSVEEFKKKGIKVYEPTGEHLYNTILVQPEKNVCPMAIVNKLAEKNIQVGTVSACENEKNYLSNDLVKPESGGSSEPPFIRISFIHPHDINKKIVDTISKTFKEEF